VRASPSHRHTQPVATLERHLNTRGDGTLRLVAIADSHSNPHPRALDSITALHPDAILHAGDIGDLGVLKAFASVCPVLAVRGNIDARRATLPDVLVVQIDSEQPPPLRILLTHIAVNGPKLRADAARLAAAERASIVVCGHSHVPFIGRDRGVVVFNPGSIGPRRFSLPIVFGVMDFTPRGIELRHLSCETGETWEPPANGHGT
jgi:putative phosphoesterase